MTIRLWHVETGEPLRSPLKGHTNAVISVAFSPDGQRIMSLSYDSTMRLWDVETGKTPKPLQDVGSVSSVAVSSDEIDIISESQNHTRDAQAIQDNDLQHLICFSLHPGHALVDTTALIDEITTPTQNISALPVRVEEHDRWTVIGPEDRLLF